MIWSTTCAPQQRRRRIDLKAMFMAFAAIAIITIGANVILENTGFSAQERTSSADVRLD